MTHEWKAGDRAMVEIVSVHGDLAVRAIAALESARSVK